MTAVPEVNLLVAAGELRLVRLLRDAVNLEGSANLVTGPLGPLFKLKYPPGRGCGCETVAGHPQPGHAVDNTVTGTPRYAPRRVIKPEPRYEKADVVEISPEGRRLEMERPLGPPSRQKLPLPPVPAIVISPVVKLRVYRTDTNPSGVLIDQFL